MNLVDSNLLKYIINGVAATLIHYLILYFNVTILEISSKGYANLIAAIFGITASFLGSKYFVFNEKQSKVEHQFFKFFILYGIFALLHGLVLSIWSDYFKLDYRAGFLVATFLQFILSYLSNKFWIFK